MLKGLFMALFVSLFRLIGKAIKGRKGKTAEPDGWICHKCSHRNANKRSVCERCGEAKNASEI